MVHRSCCCGAVAAVPLGCNAVMGVVRLLRCSAVLAEVVPFDRRAQPSAPHYAGI